MILPMSVRGWSILHKWTSLICTLFLLLLCVTGLPLVFREEIGDWLDPPQYADLPATAPRADLDRLVSAASRLYPGDIVTSVFVDHDEPQVYVFLAPSWQVFKDEPSSRRFVRFDAHTGNVLEQSKPPGQQRQTFIGLMLRLHTDLFADLPGELFLAAMGALFVVAVVSGIVLYGPFTRKLSFGTVRAGRSARIKWLDLHNLLGVVTLAWVLVVGATGIMNELSTPLFAVWRQTDVQAMLAPWHGKPAPSQTEWKPVQEVFDTVERALPGMTVASVIYPGSPLGSPHHYLLWAKGETPFTRRLLSPVLVDARTGKLTAVLNMPWYLRVLEVSRPLHFGDYGGMLLKVIWALLDGVTIVVLGSGLYLWLSRRRSPIEARIAELELLEAAREPTASRSAAE